MSHLEAQQARWEVIKEILDTVNADSRELDYDEFTVILDAANILLKHKPRKIAAKAERWRERSK